MFNLLCALMSGLIFGLGLILAGMGNPAKVLAFLDLAGNWNPSLAFVMLSAISISAVGYVISKRLTVSLLGKSMPVPVRQDLDIKLISGSLLFGVGWGLAGICPGPGIVLLGAGAQKGIIFTVAMLVGMVVFELIEQFGAARRNRCGDKLVA